MYFNSMVCMTSRVKANTFWWQGIYYCGPAHLRFILGTVRFVVGDEGPLS